jgi:hypothetical protein
MNNNANRNSQGSITPVKGIAIQRHVIFLFKIKTLTGTRRINMLVLNENSPAMPMRKPASKVFDTGDFLSKALNKRLIAKIINKAAIDVGLKICKLVNASTIKRYKYEGRNVLSFTNQNKVLMCNMKKLNSINIK